MLLFSWALAGPDLCPLVLGGRAEASGVKRAVEQGADPNVRCSWDEHVTGLQTFGGVMLAITVPVIGAVIAHDYKITRTRTATPMQLALVRGDEALFDALGESAELPKGATNTVLSGDHPGLLTKVLARGADPRVRVLVGPVAASVPRLRAAIEAGVKLDGVLNVVVAGRSLSAEWVEVALAGGIPTKALVHPVVAYGDRRAFLAAVAAVPDATPFLREAVETDRWDLFDAGLAAGVEIQERVGQETLLMTAAGTGSTRAVQRMLPLSADLSARDEHGKTALHHAASSDNPALVGLLSAGVLEAEDQFQNTALAIAVRGLDFRFADALIQAGASMGPSVIDQALGDGEVTRYLLRKGADPDALAKRGRSWVVGAIEQGDEDVLEALIAAGAKLESDEPTTSAVYAALVRYQGESWVRRLVAAGATLQTCPEPERVWRRLGRIEPAYQDWLLDQGMPPSLGLLTSAVEERDLDRVRALLKRGVKPPSSVLGEICDRHEPHESDLELVATLLAAGADPNQVIRMSQTPVHQAFARRRMDLVQLLVEHGGDLDRSGFMSRTPLTDAVDDGEHDLAEALLDLGADPGAEDAAGRAPLLLAVKKRDSTMARLLLDRGAPADCKASFRDEACVVVAIREDLLDLVPAMLAAGAPADAEDWRGAPIVQSLHDETLDAFLEAGAPVTAPLLERLARDCDLERLGRLRSRWPASVRPSRRAGKACKKDVKRLEKLDPADQ